jgi:hypothetical protein
VKAARRVHVDRADSATASRGAEGRLQTPGGVVWFFHEHRGKPIVSPALFEPIGEKFRHDVGTGDYCPAW